MESIFVCFPYSAAVWRVNNVNKNVAGCKQQCCLWVLVEIWLISTFWKVFVIFLHPSAPPSFVFSPYVIYNVA